MLTNHDDEVDICLCSRLMTDEPTGMFPKLIGLTICCYGYDILAAADIILGFKHTCRNEYNIADAILL